MRFGSSGIARRSTIAGRGARRSTVATLLNEHAISIGVEPVLCLDRVPVSVHHEFFPAQRIEMGEAIAAYTRGSAYAEFSEKEKGQIAPGMLADFIVLDRDITNATPAKLLETKVLRTVVAGKTVYEAK